MHMPLHHTPVQYDAPLYQPVMQLFWLHNMYMQQCAVPDVLLKPTLTPPCVSSCSSTSYSPAVGALCIAALGLLLYRRHARRHPRGTSSVGGADQDKLGALGGGGKLLGSARSSYGTP
jgi:hypothetical protein